MHGVPPYGVDVRVPALKGVGLTRSSGLPAKVQEAPARVPPFPPAAALFENQHKTSTKRPNQRPSGLLLDSL